MRKSVIDYMLFSCSAVMAGGLGGAGYRLGEVLCGRKTWANV